MTPTSVMAWKKELPQEVGQSAKKIYHALGDCNKVKLAPTDRLAILNTLDPAIRHVCQSLEKHYINQANGLNNQQLTIARLAQTLLQEMTEGYKLVLEEGHLIKPNPFNTDEQSLVLQKLIQYFAQIILLNYDLYAIPPKGLWKELHLAYQYADKSSLLEKNNVAIEYKRILILAITYPYQRRQNEQVAVYDASIEWAKKIKFRYDFPNTDDPGFFTINFDQDKPPTFLSRDLIKPSDDCLILDVQDLLKHLKELTHIIAPNELQARIQHHQNPEYLVPSALLKNILKSWETPLSRLNERITRDEKAQIAIGLLSTHFYLSGQKPFHPPSTQEGMENFSLSFSSANTQDGTLEIATPNIETDLSTPLMTETENNQNYPLYPCKLVSESLNGYGLVWPNNSYPPLQAGEIIGLALETDSVLVWELCTVRWLLHLNESDFKIGIERLSKTPKTGSAQLLKEGKPAGYWVRCFILESNTLMLPAFPFKSDDLISVSFNHQEPEEWALTDIVSASSMYKQFHYISKHKAPAKLENTLVSDATEPPTPEKTLTQTPDKTDDIFDSVWSKL